VNNEQQSTLPKEETSWEKQADSRKQRRKRRKRRSNALEEEVNDRYRFNPSTIHVVSLNPAVSSRNRCNVPH
jgi:hypothetical protein